MAKQTTPKAITNELRKFCADIGADEPTFVPVRPVTGKPNSCFLIVSDQVAQAGGTMVCGWLIWCWPNVFAEAEFHACWRSPAGELIDITPKQDGETKILFAPDQVRTFQGTRLPNRYLPLTHHAIVREWIAVSEQLQTASGGVVGSYDLTPRIANLMQRQAEVGVKMRRQLAGPKRSGAHQPKKARNRKD